MTEIRQCWAYNAQGIRCDHPAGHPGDHVTMTTWTDEECFSPIRHQLPPVALTTPLLEKSKLPSIPVPPDPPAADVGKCVACNHRHASGACKCGCYESIA